jgi:hypothetical protein
MSSRPGSFLPGLLDTQMFGFGFELGRCDVRLGDAARRE